MGSEQWDIRIALDAGAHGIMVPLVETRAQAEDTVHRAKYPPFGGRTSGGSFNLQSFHLEHGRTLTQQEYFANANEATLIIAIIETARGLENIDEIVQVKGLGECWCTTAYSLLERMRACSETDYAMTALCCRDLLPFHITSANHLDAIFIGQYDLALSLGALPQSDTRVIDGVERIFQASKRAGIPVIAWSPGAEAPAAVKKGYEAITVGLDTSTVTRAFAEDLALAGATQRW